MVNLEMLIHTIIQSETMEVAVQLLMAIICGGAIGIERGRKGMAAGFRTHILVCLGATLVMITNLYIYKEINAVADPTRIAAQVVSGIGFLGAGTILVTRENRVRGLTTAAGLWASACMGLAIGVKYYSLAILGCVFIFLVMTLFNRVDKRFYGFYKKMSVEAIFSNMIQLRVFIDYLEKEDVEVEDIQIYESSNDEYLLDQKIACKIILGLYDNVEYVKLMSDLQRYDNGKIKVKKL